MLFCDILKLNVCQKTKLAFVFYKETIFIAEICKLFLQNYSKTSSTFVYVILNWRNEYKVVYYVVS